PLAGLFSTIGLLYSRLEFHNVRACHLDPLAVDPEMVSQIYDELATELAISNAGEIDGWVRTAELRYRGQTWEVEIDFPAGPVTRPALRSLAAAFEDEHERLYGVRGEPNSPIELRALRVAALGPRRSHDPARVGVAPIKRDARTGRFGEIDHLVPVLR